MTIILLGWWILWSNGYQSFWRGVHDLRRGQIKEKTRISRTLHGLVFTDFFLWYFLPMSLGFRFGLCRIWSTIVLAASRRVRYSDNEFCQSLQPSLVLKPILTFPKGRNKLPCFVKDLFSQSLQPPLVLPRRGDADYSGSAKDREMQVTQVLSKTGRCRLLFLW